MSACTSHASAGPSGMNVHFLDFFLRAGLVSLFFVALLFVFVVFIVQLLFRFIVVHPIQDVVHLPVRSLEFHPPGSPSIHLRLTAEVCAVVRLSVPGIGPVRR